MRGPEYEHRVAAGAQAQVSVAGRARAEHSGEQILAPAGEHVLDPLAAFAVHTGRQDQVVLQVPAQVLQGARIEGRSEREIGTGLRQVVAVQPGQNRRHAA
jgi:hypothetical protein